VIETADLGCGSTNCLYQSVITLRPICNNQTCSRLQVSLETRKSGGDSEYKTLKSKGSLPAIVFADFKGISYACSLDRGELMTGLDFAGKQTLCQPPAEQATCLDQSPLSGSTIGPFTHGNGSCAEVSERDCASDAGIAQTSLLGSATRCVF
jgi:ribosomal protein L25 (general stress protein Ctc)